MSYSDKIRQIDELQQVQGYGGSPDLFYEFMSGLLIRSQQIMLDAISGKDIE